MEVACDVLLVGFGPVGQALALMLGRQGRSVAVLERWPERYPLPRAVCIDHEIYRILQANGLGEVLPEVSQPAPKYQWFNADWEELLAIDWSAESISGGTEVNFVHQPTLERALSAAVAEQASVQTFLGWEVVSLEQADGFCHVIARSQSGESQQYAARYVIGCDGANSIVRKAIGGEQEDRGFEADWLVIDVLLKEGVTIETLGIPPAGQYCNPSRPTTIVPAGVRDGKTFRRWEFMRLPNESVEELEQEARVWELLQPWAGPADIELVRHKVYNFRSLLALQWHKGGFLLAGDAAHVMPPFMGQGMCSGIRDAWNLSWRLGMILDCKAGEGLLETYQVERMPHVSQIIDLSIYLGKVICMPDPAQAAERDLAFRSGQAAPPPPFPHLVSGLLRKAQDGSVAAGAGLLAPHTDVTRNGRLERFDNAVGLGFVLITLTGDPIHELGQDLLSNLRRIGMRFATFDLTATPDGLTDEQGGFHRFMTACGWDTMIVRPDFYVYGGSNGAKERDALLESFLLDLHRADVVAAVQAETRT